VQSWFSYVLELEDFVFEMLIWVAREFSIHAKAFLPAIRAVRVKIGGRFLGRVESTLRKYGHPKINARYFIQGDIWTERI
jgi:hypothetical protein